MLSTRVNHFQINVRHENLAFYKDLLTFLGWKMLYDSAEMIGMADENETSFWFSDNVNDSANDYDGPGINHIGVGAASPADVDAAMAYLTERGVPMLFETPRHRPEFSANDASTYYQIMFESPDRILWEIVYTGPKA